MKLYYNNIPVFWLIVFITFLNAFALDCSLLKARYMALREDMVYEDLMREAESLINLACNRGDKKAFYKVNKG